MSRPTSRPTSRPVLLVTLAFALASAAFGQTSGAAPSGGGSFRVVRSVPGSQGVLQSGRFLISDPRSVFHVPADKKVLVYFDWEGPTGEHQFEGYWKNPEGKVVVISDYKFTARERRFGGYWDPELTPSTAAGIWTLEARIDGQVTGSHSFQVVQSEEAVAASARRMLQTAEQYRKLLASTVQLQRLDAAGRPSGAGLGVVLDKGLILTAFQVIDGASTLRIRFPDGHQVEGPGIVWLDRLRDLAILRAETGATPKVEGAPAGSWAVGDH